MSCDEDDDVSDRMTDMGELPENPDDLDDCYEEGGGNNDGDGDDFDQEVFLTEVNDKKFEELCLPPFIIEEVQSSWKLFLSSQKSREAAGEAIYTALFEAAPSLQGLFKSPRAIMAMKFMNALNMIGSLLDNPQELKVATEALAFQHLQIEVTIPSVVIFRDVIIELLQLECGDRFTTQTRESWQTVLNYLGGAMIYVRTQYSGRLEILASSWATANNKKDEAAAEPQGAADKAEGDGEGSEAGDEKVNGNGRRGSKEQRKGSKTHGQAEKPKASSWFGSRSADKSSNNDDAATSGEDENGFQNTKVPQTFNDMFIFNAAVMGFASSTWMTEVLTSFDAIVTNISNNSRLQEECDIMSLRLAKFKGTINLSEYKAVMLASLRSLVPKDWNSKHEVAWSWLWEMVERMLKNLMGKPILWEKALATLWQTLDQERLTNFCKDVYATFFSAHPRGQDFFKQSTTRLHFIVDRIVAMTLEIYRDPKKMAEDISALGLRHVGYGIPTDLFGPFVSACVQVVRRITEDDVAEESFRWSLGLIARILVRVINEGSTIVMKAINANSGMQLKKAVGCAPRGQRAMWVLKVQVGTQSISPLLWAIETGSLDAGKAIITDLLTIRADRDRYYYGMDALFERHPDVVKQLCFNAPGLLSTLLDGLVWRSRLPEGGQRRVNYYVKHLLMDAEGEFAENIEWLTDNGDPKIICHPVVVLVTDIVWARVAFRTFVNKKSWFLFSLLVFITSQSVLQKMNSGNHDFVQRIAIFGCRCYIYIISMGRWMYHHIKCTIADFRAGELLWVYGVPYPSYLLQWYDCSSLLLTVTLLIMLCTEPILYCLQQGIQDDQLFTQDCPEASGLEYPYSLFSMFAMVLYYILCIDLSVFSTHISAFVLVCGRMVTEVGLFLFALGFFVLAFSCGMSCLKQDNPDFENVADSALTVLRISLGMYNGEAFERLAEVPVLLIVAFVYALITLVFLINLLVAQLNCSYQSTYQDMLGFARLNRGKIIVECMPLVPQHRWERFVEALELDQPCEFGEGDIGVAGGLQVMEPAAANPTTVESILRYGGSTSQSATWPQDDTSKDADDKDRLVKMEKMVAKAMKRIGSNISKMKGSKGKGGSGGTSGFDSKNRSSASGSMGSEMSKSD